MAIKEKAWPMMRRAWIERRAARVGSIRRDDITAALGTCAAQASEDIQEVLRLNPGCLTYDLSAKVYVWTGLAPVLPVPGLMAEFNHPPEAAENSGSTVLDGIDQYWIYTTRCECCECLSDYSSIERSRPYKVFVATIELFPRQSFRDCDACGRMTLQTIIGYEHDDGRTD